MHVLAFQHDEKCGSALTKRRTYVYLSAWHQHIWLFFKLFYGVIISKMFYNCPYLKHIIVEQSFLRILLCCFKLLCQSKMTSVSSSKNYAGNHWKIWAWTMLWESDFYHKELYIMRKTLKIRVFAKVLITQTHFFKYEFLKVDKVQKGIFYLRKHFA